MKLVIYLESCDWRTNSIKGRYEQYDTSFTTYCNVCIVNVGIATVPLIYIAGISFKLGMHNIKKFKAL